MRPVPCQDTASHVLVDQAGWLPAQQPSPSEELESPPAKSTTDTKPQLTAEAKGLTPVTEM